MATKVTNYQCPACTGPLHFDGGSDSLLCDYCGSRFTVAEIEAQYQEKEQKAQEAFEQEAVWDTDNLEDWGEDGQHMRAYHCPSCGAELLCDETTAATSCPYCGNPTVIPGQLSGALKPDYIIPFRLDKHAATAALKQHYKKKFFLPKVFGEENHVEKLQGVYVPFWLFDGTADADLTFHATRTHMHREGSYEVTHTDHFVVRRAGTVGFTRVPVDGASKMPDDLMDSIEPFSYEELKKFSMAYLPGFLADKYDVSAQQCAQRANQRLTASAKAVMRNDIMGYELVTPVKTNVKINPGQVHYALLPVWLLNTKWKGRDFLFAMNGQTGKLVGDLPMDWKKFWLTFGALTAGLSALLMCSGVGQWLTRLILG